MAEVGRDRSEFKGAHGASISPMRNIVRALPLLATARTRQTDIETVIPEHAERGRLALVT